MKYDYKCLVCKNEFEVEQSIKDYPRATCPKCLVACENRLISGGMFILKGDGWAKDMYSSSKK